MSTSEPAHLRPISWFDDQTLSPTNDGHSFFLSPATANGKASARPTPPEKNGLDLRSIVGRLNEETERAGKAPAEEDGTGVARWDPGLSKWRWYMKARCVVSSKKEARYSAHPRSICSRGQVRTLPRESETYRDVSRRAAQVLYVVRGAWVHREFGFAFDCLFGRLLPLTSSSELGDNLDQTG
jgi:hypothetical protein